jgi:hypothetical protein
VFNATQILLGIMLNWKKKLASSLKSMELGMSGSQARWIEVFIETLLSRQKKEIIEKLEEISYFESDVPPGVYDPGGLGVDVIDLDQAIKEIKKI